MTLEELQVKIKAETNKMRSEIDEATKKLRKFDDNTKSITDSIKKAIKGISFAYIVKQLSDVTKSAISFASDLQEVQNVVDVSFGEMAYKADDFAKSAKTSFGMSELTAKRTASTFMAMSSSMGISKNQAAEMSITMAGLTGDMASFYNVSQDIAQTALKSVWTSETESLKQFGVVMTQANLQQFAFSQGITKNISDMTQAELVTLRYNYVLNTLKNVQGDFARTSDSWANQTRILSENWRELLGIIGQQAMTALTPLLTKLVDLSTWATANGPTVITIIQGIGSGIIGIGTAFLTGAIMAKFAAFQTSLTEAGLSGLGFIGTLKAVGNQINWTALAVGALSMEFATIAMNWGNLDEYQKFESILYGIAAAATAAAIAMYAFQASIPIVGWVSALAGVGTTAIATSVFSKNNNQAKADFQSWEDSLELQYQNYNGMTRNNDSIPKFATGAVLREPTLNIGGEYPNARVNPEIITPQSLMYDTMKQVINDTKQNSEISEPSEMVVNATLQLDGQTIYKNQQKIKRERGYTFDGLGAFAR